MWNLTHATVRIAAGVAGVLLLYAALFLYENEQGEIQNKLEEWWVRLVDRQSGALSRHTAFMQEVANLATRGFDRVFGEKLVSPQAVGVSVCYSIGSCLLAILTIGKFWLPIWLELGQLQLVLGAVWAAAFLALGTFPAFSHRRPPTGWYVSVTVGRSFERGSGKSNYTSWLAHQLSSIAKAPI
jgi:hypothetical protein